MSNTRSLAQQISLFCSRVQNRSLDDGTIQILDTILVAKDAESSFSVRSALKQFMKVESLVILREITEAPVEIKLLCVDFLVHVFALIGDLESCLVLRYEALVMREEKFATHPGIRVSLEEWLTFSEHSLENGFYSITIKAFEKAIVYYKANHAADVSEDGHFIKELKRLKDAATVSISTRSVQAQSAAYLKRKQIDQSTQDTSTVTETQNLGSFRFRNGIKKKNLKRLHEYKRLEHIS